MANIKISELNSLSKKASNDVLPIVDVSADETKKIKIEDLLDKNVSLIAVSDTAPAECSTGDKYFNTTTNLIYTAIDTDVWSSVGEEPIEGIFYVVFNEQSSYAYNGTTLVSVGGGTEDIIISPNEPTTDDWKIWIDSSQVNNLGSEITNSYSTSETMGYSANYVNNLTTVEDFKNSVTNFEVGVNQTTVGKCYFKRQGKLINIIYQGASKQHSVNDVLFTLPAGYRPSDEVYFSFIKGSLDDGIAVINSNGNCSVAIVGTQSQNNRIYFAVSYFLD